MFRHIYLTFICFLTFIAASSAQPFKLGSWRDHLPYIHAKTVADAGNLIYCATTEGLFSFNKSDNSLTRFTKLTGLSDVGISTIAYSNSAKALVVAYSNANIDLLFDDGSVINMSDIKRKTVTGDKTINKITIDGNRAYLSCGFAIVLLDISRHEIKDTYFIGTNGASMNIFSVEFDNTNIYAASEQGVYRASLSNPDLSNFNSWTKIVDDTSSKGDFNLMVIYNNTLLVNYSRVPGTDTLMAFNGNWGVPLSNDIPQNVRLNSIKVSNGDLVISADYSIFVFNSSYTRYRYIDNSVVPDLIIKDAFTDSDGNIWAADNLRGVLKIKEPIYERMFPDGPNSSQVCGMQVVNGKLWAVHGARSRGWFNQYNYLGFSSFTGNDWTTYDGVSGESKQMFSQYNFYDNMSIAVDPSDNNHLYAGSSGAGLLEIRDGNPLKFYRDTNSTLKQQFGNPGQVKVHGIAFDDEANLWVSNAGVNTVLNVLKNDGTWRSFNLAGYVNSSSKCGDLVIDNIGIKWLILFENVGGKEGLLAYNDNHTIDDVSDDGASIVDFSSNRVRSLAVDKDGTLWVGTEKGIYLIYPPSTTPQQILIKQDNTYQYLLETEIVTAIAVDAANRKWIGTENGGIYLFAPDGLTQVEHFTVDNSPLFSNNITSVAINGKSGEVFIGTDKGLLSYQGSAIEGGTGCTDLLVYPNPVKHEYSGPVAIKGVVPNGIVKITDISGNLVFQSKSYGAQAIWNGVNLNGERVQTGVYLVFSSDATGENTCMTKFLFIH